MCQKKNQVSYNIFLLSGASMTVLIHVKHVKRDEARDIQNSAVTYTAFNHKFVMTSA